MIGIVRVAVAEVVLIVFKTRACQANTDLVCHGPSCVCAIRYAPVQPAFGMQKNQNSRLNGSPAGMVTQNRHICIHWSSSRSSRKVCRAWPALNSAALFSWMKSEDLGVISLFASSCSSARAQLQLQLHPVLLDGRWAKNPRLCRSREIGSCRPLRRPVNQESEGRSTYYLVSAPGGGTSRLSEVGKGGKRSRPARHELGPLCSVALLVLELGCRQMPGLKI